jgi:hypothetical protein
LRAVRREIVCRALRAQDRDVDRLQLAKWRAEFRAFFPPLVQNRSIAQAIHVGCLI